MMAMLSIFFLCVSAPFCMGIYHDMRISLAEKEVEILKLKQAISKNQTYIDCSDSSESNPKHPAADVQSNHP